MHTRMELNEILLLLLLFVIVLLIILAIAVRARVSQIPKDRIRKSESTPEILVDKTGDDMEPEADTRLKELDEVLNFKNNLTYEISPEPVEQPVIVESEPITLETPFETRVNSESFTEFNIPETEPEPPSFNEETFIVEEEPPVLFEVEDLPNDEKPIEPEYTSATSRYVSPSLGDLLFPIDEPKPEIKEEIQPEKPEPIPEPSEPPQTTYEDPPELVETQISETEPVEIFEEPEPIVNEIELEFEETVEIGEYKTIDIDYPEPTVEPIVSDDNYLNIDGGDPDSGEGVVLCPHCNEKVPESLYCINCGYSLVTRGQR